MRYTTKKEYDLAMWCFAMRESDDELDFWWGFYVELRNKMARVRRARLAARASR